ncbi:DUF2306 domain-containing protein [Dokdonella fugitiva]|jgi:uncharacterized membrane protein|uniref:Putative membrane protein DUF2306 n=1 Tax=Dokdonella fugitiva TaxID=328517 RepID=A0A4V2S2D4_9GAMM|nr:DUF2306 domain-containing protein [Dokdonella fugitiva]TCO40080.1 putative membrane protein DUF2306 [Dokdonella fugitiva]
MPPLVATADTLEPAEAVAMPQAPARAGGRALRGVAAAWWVVAVAGQLLFAFYIVMFYARSALAGRPEAWNAVVKGAYAPGDTVGNLVFASHLVFALAVVAGGALQLVPRIRSRWPAVHRWNGRVFATAGVIAALGGLFMVWSRPKPEQFVQHLGISLDAVLILAFAFLAVRAARARRYDAHRRWALRLFLAVGGVWFFRIGLMAWIVANQGPAGFDPKTFSGPFLSFLAFAQYLVPLALLELYIRAQRGSARVQLAMAFGLGAATLVMAGGIAAAGAILWLPRI